MVGETIFALINGLYKDERVGMSTLNIGRAGVEDGVGIEGAMAWTFPSLSSYLVFFRRLVSKMQASKDRARCHDICFAPKRVLGLGN